MRQGVIDLRGQAQAHPLLGGKKQTFIAGRPAVVDDANTGVVLPLRRVLEGQDAPALLIRYRGALRAARWAGDRQSVRQRANIGAIGEVNGRIDVF